MNFDIEDLNGPSSCYFKGSIKVFSFLWVRNNLNPQSNIRIFLFKEGIKEPIREGFTDRCGELLFEDLDKGIYHVKAETDQRQFLPPIYKPSARVRIGPGSVLEEVAVINRFRERSPRPHHIRRKDNIISDNLLILILLIFFCGGLC